MCSDFVKILLPEDLVLLDIFVKFFYILEQSRVWKFGVKINTSSILRENQYGIDGRSSSGRGWACAAGPGASTRIASDAVQTHDTPAPLLPSSFARRVAGVRAC